MEVATSFKKQWCLDKMLVYQPFFQIVSVKLHSHLYQLQGMIQSQNVSDLLIDPNFFSFLEDVLYWAFFRAGLHDQSFWQVSYSNPGILVPEFISVLLDSTFSFQLCYELFRWKIHFPVIYWDYSKKDYRNLWSLLSPPRRYHYTYKFVRYESIVIVDVSAWR